MAARKKPCEFCEGDLLESFDGRYGHQLAVEFYPDNGFLRISSYAFDECGETDEIERAIEFNYCPMCGRKIGIF